MVSHSYPIGPPRNAFRLIVEPHYRNVDREGWTSAAKMQQNLVPRKLLSTWGPFPQINKLLGMRSITSTIAIATVYSATFLVLEVGVYLRGDSRKKEISIRTKIARWGAPTRAWSITSLSQFLPLTISSSYSLQASQHTTSQKTSVLEVSHTLWEFVSSSLFFFEDGGVSPKPHCRCCRSSCFY